MALQDGLVWRRVEGIVFGSTPALHSCSTFYSFSSLRVLSAAYAATYSYAACLCVVLSTCKVKMPSDSFRRHCCLERTAGSRGASTADTLPFPFVHSAMYAVRDNPCLIVPPFLNPTVRDLPHLTPYPSADAWA